MFSWILTSGAIAAFSIGALELFREGGSSATVIDQPRANGRSPWQPMTDAEWDAILAEFAAPETETISRPNRSPLRASTP
jgi:hypothetical protein